MNTLPVSYTALSPRAFLTISIDEDRIDWGHAVNNMEMIGMMNSGYVLEATIADTEQRLLTKFTKRDYFKVARKEPVYVYFKFLSGSGEEAEAPEYRTKLQSAIITSLEFFTPSDDRTYIKIVAIDPPSYFLNIGDASGKSYQGRVDQVIRQVVQKYGPDIKFTMKPTLDNELNRHYMMRQDAKTFIMSLLEWSAPLNSTKTNWLIGVDGMNLEISDQGSKTPVNRGYYKRYVDNVHDMIMEARTESNNALRLAAVKMYSAGSSSTRGDYVDKINDPNELKTVIKDGTTDNKITPFVDEFFGFKKPLDSLDSGSAVSGCTYVSPIPEYFSSGDLGIDYADYIDGRARNDYLTMTHNIVKSKLKVLGHGEFINTVGLGVDTIFINWRKPYDEEDEEKYFWMFGHWTVYGFRHKLRAGNWYTELYISRADEDASGKKAKPVKFNVPKDIQI